MAADQTFPDASALALELSRLHAQRRGRVAEHKRVGRARVALTRAERTAVLKKAGCRCHICGGEIDGNDWEADHVLSHSSGGAHAVENYLPAHSLCNNYRWDYGTEEFQWILKLGVWLRSQIEKQNSIGLRAGEAFVAYERNRARRRKPRE